MAIARAVRRVLPALEGDRNAIRELWDRLRPVPAGPWLFSRIVGQMAPYTGTIGAVVEALSPGRSRTSMRDRPALRNHLRSIHAVALANLAELTGNIALAYSLPDDGRFIVAGMQLDYLKKARGTVRGEGRCEVPADARRAEFPVEVELRDPSGDLVVRATLRTLVGPKAPSA